MLALTAVQAVSAQVSVVSVALAVTDVTAVTMYYGSGVTCDSSLSAVHARMGVAVLCYLHIWVRWRYGTLQMRAAPVNSNSSSHLFKKCWTFGDRRRS